MAHLASLFRLILESVDAVRNLSSMLFIYYYDKFL